MDMKAFRGVCYVYRLYTICSRINTTRKYINQEKRLRCVSYSIMQTVEFVVSSEGLLKTFYSLIDQEFSESDRTY